VILEEIAMHDDDPGDCVHDAFTDLVWPRDPLGRPVLGTVESIQAMPREVLARYWRRHYTPGNLVVAAAGNCHHDEVVELVGEAFGQLGPGAAIGPRPERARPRGHGGLCVRRRPTDQAHVVIGGPAISRSDPRRFALGVLNIAFGGGMSSRLFQEVREKRGLVYSIGSYANQYAGTGSYAVYAGAAPRRIHEVLKVVKDEVERLAADGLGEEELARAKGQFKGSLVLGMEDTSSRMSWIGKSELTRGEILTVDEVIQRVDAVTDADLRALAKELLGDRLGTLALIGPFDAEEFSEYVA
jgi:predicted Zn-dependent peptidase